MTRVTLRTDGKGCITVAFPYDPGLVQKIKTVTGRRWHPEERHWTVPHQPGMVRLLAQIFGPENLEIDPAFQVAAGVEGVPKGAGWRGALPRCSVRPGLGHTRLQPADAQELPFAYNTFPPLAGL